MTELIIFTLFGFLVVCAVAAVLSTDLMAAMVLLGCYSFFLAVIFACAGAVDVSFTEATVGGGVTTAFFLMALFRTDRHTQKPTRGKAYWGVLIFMLGLWMVLGYGALDLPAVGDAGSPPNAYLSPEYLQRSYKDNHTPNVVTSILADYRGFDTLIETTVILAAGFACFLLMNRKQT